ncbi:MAG: 50S ribosomal protein L9 [Chloroflexota bacterium]|nr:50S ribosomal protein L9 [Chloroflexota bacterium]
MRVIFLTDVPGSGTAGEVKDIKNGYARNYLLPKQLAIVANHDQLQRLEAIRKAGEEHRIREEKDLRALAEQLSQISVSLSARVGPTGRFYGSVTSSQIAEELHNLTERDIDRRTITLDNPIEEPGEYEATIHFPQGITAAIKVVVVGQDIYGRVVEMPTEGSLASSDESEATEDNTQLTAVAEASDETEATADDTQPSAVAQVSDEAEAAEDDTQPSAVAQVSDEAEATEDDDQDSKNETNTLS